MLVIVVYIGKMAVKKSCKYDKFGSFEHLLFLLSGWYDLSGKAKFQPRAFRSSGGCHTTTPLRRLKKSKEEGKEKEETRAEEKRRRRRRRATTSRTKTKRTRW